MFNVDSNQWIHLTQGDNAELDLRIFNKSFGKITFKYPPQPSKALRDSEGNLILDEEGNPIWPDVEPKEVWEPSPFRMEEWIKGSIILKVQDLQGQYVLELENSEFPNSIFIEPEHTETLDPGYYYYSLTYFNDFDEVQTIHSGLFEVVER